MTKEIQFSAQWHTAAQAEHSAKAAYTAAVVALEVEERVIQAGTAGTSPAYERCLAATVDAHRMWHAALKTFAAINAHELRGT